MNIVKPKVFLVGETGIVEDGLSAYFDHIDTSFKQDNVSDSEKLCEVYGRLCYKSFDTKLNKNLTRIREGNKDYLENIVNVGHGSVLEHATLNFIFADVSRVFTHELIRHRAGSAFSQESLRFVRLDSLSAYTPLAIKEDKAGIELFYRTIDELERLQKQLAVIYDIDNKESFKEKKVLTSAFRRLAPIGLATTIGWSCNMRTLRHVLESRTSPHAEEELRLVFGEVYNIVAKRYPNIFGDYEVEEVDGFPWIKTKNEKV